MDALLEVTDPGPANLVQDAGRRGHLAIGVPVSGAADPWLLACANRLLGNAPDEAGLEMPLCGPTLRALDAPVQLALAGALGARRLRPDGESGPQAAWCSFTLQPGERLQIGPVRAGIAYLALAGGCRVSAVLGSRSTYQRAALGGLQGRALRAGDRLAVAGAAAGQGVGLAELQGAPFVHEPGPLRVMPGPQDEAFAPGALQTLLGAPWRVGRDSDRMGIRLQGPRLQHRAGADIASEGVVPGAIQVPGDGAPIVLCVDAQTVGGYTKIATVIRADLPRLAHLRPGDELRFVAVSRAQALQAKAAQAQAWALWASRLRPCVPGDGPSLPDTQSLLALNLVSGIIDGLDDTLPWEHMP